MSVWSRVGDANNPTAFRYTYSAKTDETTGNKWFSLKPYLFDSKFLNKLVNLDNSHPMKNAKINGIKVAYTVCSGYGGSWKVQGYFTYTDSDSKVKKEFTSAISSSFVVNSDYKRIVQTINFDSVDISKIVSPDSEIDFRIMIIKPGDGTLHWHAESGMTTYIDLLVGTTSGTTSSDFEIPEENEEFRRFVDPIEIKVKESEQSSITEIKLKGNNTEEEITLENGIWPVWPYEEQVVITCYKGINNPAFTRNINIISEEYFNLNPSVYRRKENNNTTERKFDGECIELNLDFKISNNSFINNNNVLNIEIYQESALTPLYTTTYTITNTTENFIINIIPMLDETHYYKIAADEETTLIVKISLKDSSPTILLFTQAILIPKAVPIFNIEENGVAIGKFLSTGENNEKKFEVGYPAYFENTVQFNNHLSGAIFKGEVDCSEGIKGVTNFPNNDSTAQPIGYFGNNRVYSKVITYKFTSSDNTRSKQSAGWYEIRVDSPIINAHYINAYGYVKYTSSDEFPISYYQSSTNFSMCYLDSNQITIHCQHGTDDIPAEYMVVFIYYVESSN